VCCVLCAVCCVLCAVCCVLCAVCCVLCAVCRSLVLDYNHLVGTIPTSIGDLMDLGCVRTTDTFSQHDVTVGRKAAIGVLLLGLLLQKLHVAHPRMKGVPHASSRRGRYLSLAHNQLSGDIPSSIGSLHNTL
jgi:hypothetical protein